MDRKQPILGPFEQFEAELDGLIAKWSSKTLDDRPSYAEVIGLLELKKSEILRNYLSDLDDEAEDEE